MVTLCHFDEPDFGTVATFPLLKQSKALASMWQVTNDLDLQFEQLYDLGV